MVPRPKSRPIMGVFDMIRLLASCVSVANRAGQIIKEVAQQGMLGVVDKARWIEANLFFLFTLVIPQNVRDYQTEADRKAQRCIVSTLAARFPNITIVAEEVGSVRNF